MFITACGLRSYAKCSQTLSLGSRVLPVLEDKLVRPSVEGFSKDSPSTIRGLQNGEAKSCVFKASAANGAMIYGVGSIGLATILVMRSKPVSKHALFTNWLCQIHFPRSPARSSTASGRVNSDRREVQISLRRLAARLNKEECSKEKNDVNLPNGILHQGHTWQTGVVKISKAREITTVEKTGENVLGKMTQGD
ncbi:hypothetical protein BJ165DRAFT_1397953 [Panaeolus papilionaceus]|nr:hypothetical protein BJ165DRAFT_1397953 [Panaeolus papilionaceus]